jgi:hypothetical protein
MSYIKSNRGPNARPLLKSQIEEAQLKSKSARGAARFLGVDYKTYKKYAQLYGVFENLKNPRGLGIRKGRSIVRLFPIEEILEGKHPNYDLFTLKKRLIRGKYLEEECMQCGFKERRVTDGKVPLILNVRDGNKHNLRLDNLALLCYNCTYLMHGRKHTKQAYKLDDDDNNIIDQINELSRNSIVRNNTVNKPTEIAPVPQAPQLDVPNAAGMTLEEIEAMQAELRNKDE